VRPGAQCPRQIREDHVLVPDDEVVEGAPAPLAAFRKSGPVELGELTRRCWTDP
jgi:hypothetical protein